MKKSKFKTKASQFVFVLLIASLFGVGYFAFKDAFRTPEEQLAYGLELLDQKKYAAAESVLIRATQSESKPVVVQAAWRIGNLYRMGAKNFAVNGRKAEMFLERAASFGYAPAQYELALMYDIGDKIPENRKKAIAWMNYAAQSGLPEALYGLGVWVERGYLGKVDMDKVLSLYEQAAQKGHINAMKSLIVLYSEGWDQFPRNEERVVYWSNRLSEIQQATRLKKLSKMDSFETAPEQIMESKKEDRPLIEKEMNQTHSKDHKGDIAVPVLVENKSAQHQKSLDKNVDNHMNQRKEIIPSAPAISKEADLNSVKEMKDNQNLKTEKMNKVQK